ncbi:tape measure protein [Aulosira sp. FACHB-615]|uniref:tape measure protein n=1 Tax=Aulosira sp. FACHB-615 TaxID=2692777 RepID=UPI001689B259|nr:tape measure protein [Aulosira sp. FACHB-615]MBD2489010.1 tape measure protein [Aulosira sp. FACHB-615]
MSSAGSISLELKLSRTKFDQDLAKLQQEKFAIPVKLKLDTKDFERQVKGLTGFLPTILVPVKLDVQPQAVKQQFQEIGRYAALGFKDGFSGAEDAGKAAIDSMVRSVNKQLGIASPSKVFRQIGKHAADGLLQGLEIDKGKLRSIVNGIEAQFKLNPISVELDPELGRLQRKLKSLKSSVEINPDFGDISKAVEKGVKGASSKNIFAVLTGGLLKAVAGIGTGLLGVLLSPFKAVAGAATTVFAGAGLKLGEELSTGITSGIKTSIKDALSNSIGSGAVVGEALGEAIAVGLEQVIKSRFPNAVKQASQVTREILGEEKVFAAGAASRAKTQASQQKEREIATAQLQKEFQKSVGKGEGARARQLKGEIDAIAPGLAADTKAFTSEYASEQKRLQEAAAKFRVILTPERLIKRRVKEYEEQVKKYEQIIAQLEQQGNKAQALKVKQILAQIKPPDTDASKISDQEIRLQQALQLSKIQNQFVARNLNQQFGARASDLQQRKAQLAPKVQEYNAITGRIGGIAKGLEVLGAEPVAVQAKPKAQSIVQPQLYKSIFEEVLSLSGVKANPNLIPQLAISNKLRPGALGTYDAGRNQIDVSKEAYELIQKGKIDAAAIETLVHELRHAVQFNFGKANVASGKAAIPLLSPNAQEVRQLGRRIESSVEVQSPELQPISRKLEADAYVFASRNSKAVTQKLQKESAITDFEKVFGLGGSKAELQIKRSQTEAVKRLIKIGEFAKQYGLDLQHEMASLSGELDQIAGSIAPLLGQAANLEALSTQEIEQIQQKLESVLSGIIASINATPEKLKAIVVAKTSQPKASPELEANLSRLNAKDIRALSKDLGVPTYNKEAKKNFTKSELIQNLLGGVDPKKLEAALPNVGKPSPEVLAQAKELVKIPRSLLKLELEAERIQLKEAFKEAKSKGDIKALRRVLDDIQKSQELVTQALAQNIDADIKAELDGFRLSLARKRYQAKGEIGKLNMQQSGAAGRSRVPSVSQMAGGNSFESLASFEDVENALAAARASLSKFISQARNGASNSSAYGDFYAKQIAKPLAGMEKEAKAQEKSARAAAEQTKKELEAAKRLLEQAKTEQKVIAQIDARLKELENVNAADPSIGANLAIDDANKSKQRREDRIKEFRAAPLEFLQQRSRNATIQKARYITENAEGIANLVGAKVGENPTAKQTKAIIELQSAFGTLGEAATKFGQKQTKSNFKELDTAVKELEASLRKLGVPFTLINQEIDAYTNKLKRLQGEGKIDIEVDVESLAPEKFSFIDNLLSKFSGLEARGIKAIAGIIKGFLSFGAITFVQQIFTNIAQDAFKAYVELDRLKTALNFASGGAIGGAQNLAFVRKTVDDLKVPLKASTEGFVQLAAAAKGSALEGRQSRELFLGISQASTVLSLSADNTQGAILALSQMISKGKVSAEELRQQLGERLPGAMGIASRAMGVAETEFTRLLDSGQILSQDFLPKFAKQLQAEFGDAAKDAAGNAQSAIFDLQNSFLGLQQGIGEGIAPAATAGLGAFATILKGVAAVSKELGFILLSVVAVLSGKMVAALGAVINQMIAAKVATGTLSSGLASMGQTLNNSASVKWAAGIFAVLEIVNLLNQAINTDLVQSFENAAKAANRAAHASEKAFNKAKGKPESDTPEASSGVSRFLDKYLIGFLNMDVGPFKGGNPFTGKKIKTYGERERDKSTGDARDLAAASDRLSASATLKLRQLQKGSGDIGQLPAIDATLRDAEQQRQILQAGIKRNFTDKGLAVPAQDKRRLDAQNLRITDLNNQRADIAKPFTLDLSRADGQINAIKAQIEVLKSPESIAAVGGEEAALKLTEQLKGSMERLKQFKAEAENALASLRVDPVLAFTQSLRQLNLTLAENQEKNEQTFNNRRSAIASTQLAGFSSNKLATRNAALQSAMAERDRNQANFADLQAAISKTDSAIASPEFQSTLQRLGVSPDSSVAAIDDRLKNTSDEGDKGILERLKSAREQKNRLSEARTTLSESQLKVRQTTQDNSLFNLEDSAASSRAATQKAENQKIALIRQAQADRTITEEAASEKISRIQLQSTQSQRKNLDNQLIALRHYYTEGQVSAEEYAKRERDLTVEQTNLERTEAENRLAVQQAVLQRRLKDIEFANKKAESAIAISALGQTQKAKENLLASGLTQSGQDKFALQQNAIDQKSTTDKIALLKTQLAQTKKLREEGVLSAREAAEKEMSLNQELAQNNLQLVDQKIAAEEKYRETVERNIQRIMQAEENRFKSLTSQLDAQKTGLELYSASLERVKTLEESRFNLSKALSDAAIAPLETRRDNAGRALELSRRLKDDNLDPAVKSAITSQLGALGFGTNELEILAKRSRIEDEIAAKKLEALKLEQDFQKKSLQLDLQRQKISAQTAVYDAQSAQLSAAKSKLEAEAALRIAQVKKDPAAIESAKIGIEIANREADLSNQKLDNAIANLSIQDELSRNAILAQEVTQRSAIDQQLAADGARKQASALEKVEASVKRTSETQHSVPGTQNSDNWENPFIQKKGESMFDYGLRINKAKMLGQIIETNNRTWGKSDEVIGGGLPPIDRTAAMVDAVKIAPQINFADSLKSANQGVEQRLDTLSDRILQLANTPRSLSVSTPNPVDDAAKIMNDVSRAAVRGSGI